MDKGFANPQLLMTPQELADAIDARVKQLVLDLRPAEDFAAGHIPGAVHVDLWGVSLIDTDPAPLKAFMWMIEHVLVLRGVDKDTPVIVYDEQSGVRAARAFWFLEYFGHPRGAGARRRVQCVDPGRPCRYPRCTVPTASAWSGTPQPSRIASWRDVKERLIGRDAVILDTRSDEEHYGTLVRAKRGGAIPGAVHIEWTRNLTTQGDFKPASELRAIYERAGVTPDKEIVTYCQGGYRAAHGYLALRLLGYPRVRNYTGSWKEWGDREDLPIEVPRRSDEKQ